MRPRWLRYPESLASAVAWIAFAVVVCIGLWTLLFIVPGLRFMLHSMIAQLVEPRDGTPAAIAIG
jgi:hypothetical protein